MNYLKLARNLVTFATGAWGLYNIAKDAYSEEEEDEQEEKKKDSSEDDEEE